MTSHRLVLGLLLAAGLGAAAHAATPVVLDFHGLDGGDARERPGNFYNGGFGSEGSGRGPAFGITFSDDALVACKLGFACDDPEAEGQPTDVLRFLDPRAAFAPGLEPEAPSVMNVAGGFTDAVSFIYASSSAGSIRIWSGANGTGTLLGSMDLHATCKVAELCPFEAVDKNFTGLGHSVEFVDFDFHLAGFDDIGLTLADAHSAAPEPAAWGLMIGGFGLAGATLRRRRSLAA
jgi:hypothetical protein